MSSSGMGLDPDVIFRQGSTRTGFLFDLPADTYQEFEDAIAVGLGIPKIDPVSPARGLATLWFALDMFMSWLTSAQWTYYPCRLDRRPTPSIPR